MTRARIFRITLVSDNFFFLTCPAVSSKHPAILHTKSSNKMYLWLEGSLVSQPNVCGGFFGKTGHFFSAIKEVYTKSFFLLIALVENLNANNMNLLAAAADIDVMTCRNKEWSFELSGTQNTSI